MADYESVRAAAICAQTVNFWAGCSVDSWASAARRVLLLSPSSASCERVFSVLNGLFSDRKLSCLEDYIETSILLRCNNAWRRGLDF